MSILQRALLDMKESHERSILVMEEAIRFHKEQVEYYKQCLKEVEIA